MNDSADESQSQVDDLLAQYMDRLDREEQVDVEEFLSRHPEHADELRDLIEADHLLGQLKAQDATASIPPTIVPGGNTSDPRLGTRIRYVGDYELLDEIARGGMGIVYKARQLSLNRVVAIKMIRSGELAYDDEIQRFQNEAEAVARLQHPNIVSVHEVGEHDGHSYFSMDLVEGQNLSDLVREHPLPVREAARHVKQAAEAIQYAHEQGVLHRDIKPSNILVDTAGQVHITDFGLAKSVASDSSLTHTGQVLGTPSYMPPEQAAGNNALMGPASDVYSLGAVLYELITGRPPFAAATPVETIRQVLEKESLSPRLLNTEVPKDLETICLKCLEKTPTQRYLTAGELADELNRYLTGQPIQARPLGWMQRTTRWSKRRPAAAALVLVSAVAALAVVGLSVGFRYQRQLERANGQLGVANSVLEISNRKLTQSQRAEVKAKNELDNVLYFRDVALALSAWNEGKAARAQRLLDECPKHLRSWEWHYVNAVCQPELFTLPSQKVQLSDKSIVFRSDERTVRILNRDTGQIIRSFSGHLAVFSANGARVAALDENNQLRIWETESGIEIQSVKVVPKDVRQIVFCHDGSRIAIIDARGILEVRDVESGRQLSKFEDMPSAVSRVALSPDGTRVAMGDSAASFNYWMGSVKLWDSDSGRLLRTLEYGPKVVSKGKFAPDGTRFVAMPYGRIAENSSITVSPPMKVTVIDSVTGRTILTAVSTSEDISISQDGSRMASSTGGDVQIWNMDDGLLIQTIRPDLRYGGTFDLSPDGKLLSTTNNSSIVGEFSTIQIWNVETGQLLSTLDGHTRMIYGFRFNAAGTRFASCSGDKSIKIWSVPDGKEIQTLYGHSSRVSWCRFSPDGKRMISSGGDIKVWDVEEDWVTRRGTYSPDGSRIAVWHQDQTGKIEIRRTRNEQVIQILGGHRKRIWCVAFNPDGSKFASGDRSGMIKVWDVESGRTLLELGEHTKRVECIVFSPDSTQIASVDLGGTVRLWNAFSGRPIHTFSGAHNTVCGESSLAFDQDGKRLVSAGIGERGDAFPFKIWDTQSGRRIRPSGFGRGRFSAQASHSEFSPDGKWILSNDLGVTIRNAETGQLVRSTVDDQGNGTTQDVAYSPDGSRIFGRDSDGLKIWDAESGREILTVMNRMDMNGGSTLGFEWTRIFRPYWNGEVRVRGRTIIPPRGNGARE